MPSADEPSDGIDRAKADVVLLLRWVLIIATSYLVLFSRSLSEVPPSAAIFVAAYLASNIVLAALLPRIRSQRAFDIGVVLLDTVAVSVGLALTDNASNDFFLLYFVVMFLGALTERLGVVVGAAVLISVVHMYTVSSFVGFGHLIADGYILRIPFLFVVALFFGHLVENARNRGRDAQEARLRERMRTEFVSGVTHDLKNPLGVIQQLAMMMLEGNAGAMTAQQTDLIRRIQANVRRVITLSLNLLDATRIEAGRLTLQRTPANIFDVVDDSISLARSASYLKGVSLDCETPAELPIVDVDVMQMERAISNLLDNAIKYTPTGGKVVVTIRPEPQELTVSVADNGPGISTQALGHLFEKYRRQPGSSRIEGSGLGLFLVKAIVEGHEGSVEATSTIGRGTAITIHLPIAHPEVDPQSVSIPATRRRWFGTRRASAPGTRSPGEPLPAASSSQQ